MRSTKRLLVRVMGNHHFSYEEFTTVLCQVEAVLNSRPLTPSDPADLDYLSPGHFLIGQPLLAVPPRTSTEDKSSLVNRWKLLDQCHQALWWQWSTEYLTTLQARTKWSTGAPNVRPNDVAVIRDNQSPPLSDGTGDRTVARSRRCSTRGPFANHPWRSNAARGQVGRYPHRRDPSRYPLLGDTHALFAYVCFPYISELNYNYVFYLFSCYCNSTLFN